MKKTTLSNTAVDNFSEYSPVNLMIYSGWEHALGTEYRALGAMMSLGREGVGTANCQDNTITCKQNSCTPGKRKLAAGLSMEQKILSVVGASSGIAKMEIFPALYFTTLQENIQYHNACPMEWSMNPPPPHAENIFSITPWSMNHGWGLLLDLLALLISSSLAVT
ncbi:hypothetical protein C5167_015275 [Papaver somniferum]|uniref:Uncharacterized protein n=1 Tax=Papaver somniferum TaxID=3469 RepID=A0A4Y7J9X2_PAPSO|nr:hypothetical protein C5167_015275 [Papaver somniferum]